MWADAIANYTHWAWSDVDVVYGDLGRVLMPHVRSARAHSVITMTPNHEHWCDMSHALFSGQLTVFRNDAATNALFKLVKDWGKCFRGKWCGRFDEIDLPNAVLDQAPSVPSVLFLESQLTPQGSEHRRGYLMHDATLVWLDGRLVLLDGGDVARGPLSEAGLVHLKDFKGDRVKTWQRSGPASFSDREIDAPRGFLMPLYDNKAWRPLTDAEIAQLAGGRPKEAQTHRLQPRRRLSGK